MTFFKWNQFRSAIFIICSLFSTCIQAQETPSTWPQWRGPARDCRATGSAWPSSLSPRNIKKTWQVELSPSYSGPIVSNDRVYVTETRESQYEVVRALERSTGREIWQAKWPGSMKVPFFANTNGSWIRSTPALDGNRLYVAGMRDVLTCLNAESGEIVWQVNFVKRFKSKIPSFGFASSPLIENDHIIVQAGGGVVKLDKLTGKTAWRGLVDDGGMSGSAFSSPTIATINGKKQLVVQTRKELAGADLATGQKLWSQEIPAFRGMNIVTPTVIEGSVFTSSYGGGSFLYDVRSANGSQAPKFQWKNKVQAYMSSPVVIDGHVYLHLRNQRFACIEIASGKERWISKPYGKYCSMVTQGDRILALDERGDLMLIRANPEKFDLLSSQHISDDPTWAHLAVCTNEIFVRSLNSQMAFQWNE
jgi:outer membrane protein assembly factor BamB